MKNITPTTNPNPQNWPRNSLRTSVKNYNNPRYRAEFYKILGGQMSEIEVLNNKFVREIDHGFT